MSGYRFKGKQVIINGEIQKIVPSTLPGTPVDGYIAIDQADGKLKIYNEDKARWLVLGDAEDVVFDNSTNNFIATDVQAAIEEINAAVNPLAVSVVLQHNGTISNGTWIGYDSLLPGNQTPIIAPITGNFIGFTWSNSEASADFDLEFKKNSTEASSFYTWSVTDKKTDEITLPSPQAFIAGDTIYIKYTDTGTNATDAVIVLKFKA